MKQAKKLRIVHTEGGQCWIGDGRGMWLVDESVEVNEKNAACLLDIDHDKYLGIDVMEGTALTEMWGETEKYPDEIEMHPVGSIITGDEQVEILKPEDCERIILVPTEYARDAVKSDEERKYYAAGTDCNRCIAVTHGMNVKMLLTPLNHEKTKAVIKSMEILGRMSPEIRPNDPEEIGEE